MIIDKQPLPDDPTPFDAPPSYDALNQATSRPVTYPPAEKPSSITASSSAQPSFSSWSARSPTSPQTTSPKAKAKAKGSSNWFPFASRTSGNREVRDTVLGLVRGLVRQHQFSSSSAIISILDSCAEACSTHDLSLPSLLQENFIEGHTPLYWAIVKRPPETSHPEDQGEIPDFLTILMSFTGPLSQKTRSEMRLACLLTSDQPLFQRLRLSPEFAPLSGTDEILLGASMPPDEITVSDVPGDEGAFVVNFGIVLFQQRMRVSKRIELEFIARGRLWCLSFFVASESQYNLTLGVWYISLSILPHSPPTWIDSRLLIEEPLGNPPSPPLPLIDDEPSPSSKSPIKAKLKPTIIFRLKSGGTQLIAPPDDSSSHKQSYAYPRHEIVVRLDDSMMGSGLQYDGSSYISPNGMLYARLEARLAKPEAECIVC